MTNANHPRFVSLLCHQQRALFTHRHTTIVEAFWFIWAISLRDLQMCFTRVSDGNSAGLTLYSDDESDLIRELQTLCSSKSEPDISKVIQHSIQFKLLQVCILYSVNSEFGVILCPVAVCQLLQF